MSYYKPDPYDEPRYDIYGTTPAAAALMPDGSGMLKADTTRCRRDGNGWDCNEFVADYTYSAYEDAGS